MYMACQTIVINYIQESQTLMFYIHPVGQTSGQIDISGQSEVAVFRVNAAVISEGVVKFNYNAAQINLEAMLGKKMAEILQSK